jgi:hypothetical protein
MIISVGWKTSTQNNSFTIDLSEKDSLGNHYRDHYTDKIVKPRQVIYWPNFIIIITIRRRRRRKRKRSFLPQEWSRR